VEVVMSVLNCTVVAHQPGKKPEILLSNRPFSDCDSVGSLWTHNTVVQMLGRYDEKFVVRTRKVEELRNLINEPYSVSTDTTSFMGVAKLCEYYVVEN
jgi:hypothetical protein